MNSQYMEFVHLGDVLKRRCEIYSLRGYTLFFAPEHISRVEVRSIDNRSNQNGLTSIRRSGVRIITTSFRLNLSNFLHYLVQQSMYNFEVLFYYRLKTRNNGCHIYEATIGVSRPKLMAGGITMSTMVFVGTSEERAEFQNFIDVK